MFAALCDHSSLHPWCQAHELWVGFVFALVMVVDVYMMPGAVMSIAALLQEHSSSSGALLVTRGPNDAATQYNTDFFIIHTGTRPHHTWRTFWLHVLERCTTDLRACPTPEGCLRREVNDARSLPFDVFEVGTRLVPKEKLAANATSRQLSFKALGARIQNDALGVWHSHSTEQVEARLQKLRNLRFPWQQPGSRAFASVSETT